MHSHRLIPALAACLALLFSTSFARAGDGKISGTVTFKGKSVEAAKVVFHLENGEFVGAKIKEDGTYSLSRVPAGAWKITIEGKDVPAKYASEETSGLTFTVKEGSSKLDIELR
jgi:hypothetical protein